MLINSERLPQQYQILKEVRYKYPPAIYFILRGISNKPIEYFYGEDYIGEDIQDLIAIIRRMDPDMRAVQIPTIKSILLLQQKTDEINLLEIEDDEEALKAHAMELYNFLIPYLTNITELRAKGFLVKSQLEEALGINDTNKTSIE